MFVTENLAALCALLIDDTFGELPSRIFTDLVKNGRSSTLQLAEHTSLTPKQIRHGLVVLIQHNLVYISEDQPAYYTANPSGAYNILRSGWLLESIEIAHGAPAKDVAQSLLVHGQTKVFDLNAAYETKLRKKPDTNGEPNPFEDELPPQNDALQAVESVEHLNSVLTNLVRAEIVEGVNKHSFDCAEDRYLRVKDEVTNRHFPEGIKGARKQEEFEKLLANTLHDLRESSRSLKRKLPANGYDHGLGPAKARKVTNGDVKNCVHDHHEAPLDPNAVLRVNFERAEVEYRNQQLVAIASEYIGDATGKVYGALLELMTEDLPRCRDDPRIDPSRDRDDEEAVMDRAFSTEEILNRLPPSVDVSTGIGKALEAKIDVRMAERIQRHPPGRKVHLFEAEVEGEDIEEEDEEEEHEVDSEGERLANQKDEGFMTTNGTKDTRVKFEDPKAGKHSRRYSMRQHLLLLCDHNLKFVRHYGHGMWTVDFEPVIRNIQMRELDNFIKRKCGRTGLRLARILRDKGKLDEKTLPNLALMKKGEVAHKMLDLQSNGFADVQEVPRDSNRTVSRTIFLWYCDEEKSMAQFLDDTYKAILRCLQIREVQRQANREVLSVAERPDVKGNEKESLEKKYFEKYEKYRQMENQLLSQVQRLDATVAMLRDF